MKRIIVATAAVVAAAGFSGSADAARFYLTNGRTMYSGSTGGGGVVSASLGIGSARSPAIGFDSKGNLYAAINSGGTATIHQLSGFENLNAFAPTVGAVIGTLASETNSFDFRGTGTSERMIGTRNDTGSPQYFESSDSTYSAYVDVGAGTGFGSGPSYPSSGYDRTGSGTYWAVTAGSSSTARSIVTIATGTGLATDTGLNLTFDGVGDQGDLAYGTIVLAGGDYVESLSAYFISFYSEGLGMAVIGTLDLTTGDFTEEVAFSLVGANEGTMGLAVVIPAPLAGGMSVAGLMLVGARRRRATI